MHNRSISQSKHICIAPYVGNESEAHNVFFHIEYTLQKTLQSLIIPQNNTFIT